MLSSGARRSRSKQPSQRLNTESAQAAGLRGAWVMTDPGGVQLDWTGRCPLFVPAPVSGNPPTFQEDPEMGRPVAVYAGDGSGQYSAVASSAAINVADNQTVMFWVNWVSFGTDAFHGILARRSVFGPTQFGFNWRPGGTNLLQCYYRTGGTFRAQTTTLSSNFSTGTWYHLAATFAKNSTTTDVTLYKNGKVLTGPTNLADNIASVDEAINFGRTSPEAGGIEYGNVKIAEFRLYDIVVPPTVIWQAWAPSSRWELYQSASRRRLMNVSPPPPALPKRRKTGTQASTEPAAEYVW